MKFPEREDFLDYVEGAPLADADVQKRILHMLASSPLYREQCRELKRDLYLVDIQVPEYRIREEYAAELAALAQTWLKLRLERRYGLKGFTRGREFVTLMIGLTVVLVLLCGFMLLHLSG